MPTNGTATGRSALLSSLSYSVELLDRLLVVASHAYMELYAECGREEIRFLHALAAADTRSTSVGIEAPLATMRERVVAFSVEDVSDEMLVGALLLVIHHRLAEAGEALPTSETGIAFERVVEELGLHRDQVWVVAVRLARRLARTEQYDAYSSLRALRMLVRQRV